MHMLAAVSELIIALLSFYLSAANILNMQFGYEFLKIGKPIEYFRSGKGSRRPVALVQEDTKAA